MNQIVIATHNAHKLKEFQAGFAGTDYVISHASEHSIGDIPETGTTFCENAFIKAQAVMDATGLAAMGDDSGIIIEALGDFPGLYSKRFADECGGHEQAVAEILKRLDGKPATAYYICVLALCRPGQDPLVTEGRVYGTLVWPRQGDSNFGYDPWFRPDGEDRTFGQMNLDEKRALDHRTQALQAMLAALKDKP